MNRQKMDCPSKIALWLALVAAPGGALFARQQSQQQAPPPPPAQQGSSQQGPPQQTEPPAKHDKSGQNAVNVPRGKKLHLKDGSVLMVREYARTGETVRYYSLLESQWEEIPASLVDWDATAKAESEEAQQQKEYAAKIATQERNQNAMVELDIDASLEVAPGVILPQDEGMFALAGKTVFPLQQTMTEIKTDKGRAVERIITPIPVVSARQRMILKGKRSAIRLPSVELQFFYRIPADEPDPAVELVRVHQDGDTRRVEWISITPQGTREEQRDKISILKWQIANGVFRFTVSQPIEPGEYALGVATPDGFNTLVWDFGVDKAGTTPAKPQDPKSK